MEIHRLDQLIQGKDASAQMYRFFDGYKPIKLQIPVIWAKCLGITAGDSCSPHPLPLLAHSLPASTKFFLVEVGREWACSISPPNKGRESASTQAKTHRVLVCVPQALYNNVLCTWPVLKWASICAFKQEPLFVSFNSFNLYKKTKLFQWAIKSQYCQSQRT